MKPRLKTRRNARYRVPAHGLAAASLSAALVFGGALPALAEDSPAADEYFPSICVGEEIDCFMDTQALVSQWQLARTGLNVTASGFPANAELTIAIEGQAPDDGRERFGRVRLQRGRADRRV